MKKELFSRNLRIDHPWASPAAQLHDLVKYIQESTPTNASHTNAVAFVVFLPMLCKNHLLFVDIVKTIRKIPDPEELLNRAND